MTYRFAYQGLRRMICGRDEKKELSIFILILLTIMSLKPISAESAVSADKISRVPLYGQIRSVDKAEDVIVESDDNEKYSYKMIKDIIVDSKGNIFLLDADKIFQYGREGRFIKTIGRNGQGPGEFINPLKLFIDDKDHLYVDDQGRSISEFDGKGVFVESIRLKFSKAAIPLSLRKYRVDDEGNIIAIRQSFDEKGIEHTCVMANRSGEIIREMFRIEQGGIRVKGTAGGGAMGGLEHPYSQKIHICFLSDGTICYGNNTSASLHLADTAGKDIVVFGKEEKPESLSRAEIDHLGIKKDEIPEHKPYFKDILCDERGRIYVIRISPILEKRTDQDIDIFSRDGRYLYQMKTPLCPMVIKNGYFYGYEYDENDRVVVKRLLIPDYDSLKY